MARFLPRKRKGPLWYPSTAKHISIRLLYASCEQTLHNVEMCKVFLGGMFVASCIDRVNIRPQNAILRSAVVAQKLADHYFVAYQMVHFTNQISTTDAILVSFTDKKELDKLVAAHD